MKRSALLYFLSSLLLASLLITGCELFLGDPSLTSTQWTLKAIENTKGEVIFRPDPDREYWIRFNRDSTITAMNACNECIGLYQIRGATLSIGMGCTESACGTPAPYLDYSFDLNRTMGHEIKGGELRINSLSRDSTMQTLVHVPR